MVTNNKISIDQFSPHLFWDVNRDLLNMDENAGQIIERVLGYGLLQDWKLIQHYYGLNRIGEVCKHLRNLDEVSMHFIARLTQTPYSEFQCYKNKQSTKSHWIS